ncbi:hypothetical protein BC940DRAFT_126831 [Gongronella butleri]|nr:hypothetical protein BC940DRAFT_126831 [Gongronella butleri]
MPNCTLVDDKIIYLGGMQWNLTTDYFYIGVDKPTQAIPMNYIFYQDLATGYFNTSSVNVFGNKPSSPTARYWHTATELPGHKVFMYGGAFQGVAVRDYAYILDTNTLLWSQVQFPQVNDNSCSKPGAKCGGPRFGHSAILVNNELLYIMFGASEVKTLLNDTLILNTTSMMWLDSSVTTSVNNGEEISPISTPASNGLSGGAIAGIAVGVVVGVGVIIGAAVFFALKKRKQRDAVPAPPAFYDIDLTSGKMPSQKPQWNPNQATDNQDMVLTQKPQWNPSQRITEN